MEHFGSSFQKGFVMQENSSSNVPGIGDHVSGTDDSVEELSSLEILQRAPRSNPDEMKLTQVYYKCRSDVCNALGFPNLEGYCAKCFIRCVRLRKIKSPQTENSNFHFNYQREAQQVVETESSKSRRPVGFSTNNIATAGQAHIRSEASELLEPEVYLCSSPGCFNLKSWNTDEMCKPCLQEKMMQTEDVRRYLRNPKNSSSKENGIYQEHDKLYQEREKISPRGRGQACLDIPAKTVPGHCLMPGCDMYGSLETAGYCSKCILRVIEEESKSTHRNHDETTTVHIKGPPVMGNDWKSLKPVFRSIEPENHNYSTAGNTSGTLVAKPVEFRSLPPQGKFAGVFSGGHISAESEQQRVYMTSEGEASVLIGALFVRSSPEHPLRALADQTPVFNDIENIPSRFRLGAGQGNGHAMTSEEDASTSYDRMNSQLENGAKRSSGKCKNINCSNFGNSRCKGFCNTCFKSLGFY